MEIKKHVILYFVRFLHYPHYLHYSIVFSMGILAVLTAGPFFSARGQNFIPPQNRPNQQGSQEHLERPNPTYTAPRQRPSPFPRDDIRDDRPRPRRDRPRWWSDEKRTRQRQRRLQQAREMARRLIYDPNTSAAIREQAQRLDSTLTRIEDLEQELRNKREEFLLQHQAERRQLRALKERMERIHQNLKAAREQAKADNLAKLHEIKRSTQEARTLAQELRRHYRGQHQRRQDRRDHIDRFEYE